MIVWFIGMSGAGKSAIGSRVHSLLKDSEPNTVLVDGDVIRKFFPEEEEVKSYTIENRKKNSLKIRQICKWLDEQSINVVCCILSIFPEASEWNKANYSDYFEIYIKVPFEELVRRDQKGLYTRAKNKEESNVVGFDIPFPEPENPDLILENGSELKPLEILAKRAYNEIMKRKLSKLYPYDQGNRLESRNTYAYSELSDDFLCTWKKKRELFLSTLDHIDVSLPKQEIQKVTTQVDTGTTQLLLSLLSRLQDNSTASIPQELLKLVNKFEVSKRLYPEYSATWKAIGNYDNMEHYLLFSEVLTKYYTKTKRLDLLNALLKCNDTLIACSEILSYDLQPRLKYIITKELELVENLRGGDNE